MVLPEGGFCPCLQRKGVPELLHIVFYMADGG